MAGIEKASHQFEFDLMLLHQPVDHRSRRLGCRQRLIVRRVIMRLGDEILCEEFRTVLDTGLFLQPGAGCRNETCGKRGGAGRVLIPLQNQNLLPLIMSGKGRHQPASPCPDDDDWNFEIELNALSGKYGHDHSPPLIWSVGRAVCFRCAVPRFQLLNFRHAGHVKELLEVHDVRRDRSDRFLGL